MVVQCKDIENGRSDGLEVDLTTGQHKAAVYQAILLVEILQPLLGRFAGVMRPVSGAIGIARPDDAATNSLVKLNAGAAG